MKTKPPLEKEIQAQILAYLALLPGVLAWRQNAGGMKANYKGKERFFRFASRPGISDIIGVLPASRHGVTASRQPGRFLAVECKRPGGKLSLDQAAFLDAVRAAGGLALVVHSLDELIEALCVEGYLES
jgi:hypothetical protein